MHDQDIHTAKDRLGGENGPFTKADPWALGLHVPERQGQPVCGGVGWVESVGQWIQLLCANEQQLCLDIARSKKII